MINKKKMTKSILSKLIHTTSWRKGNFRTSKRTLKTVILTLLVLANLLKALKVDREEAIHNLGLKSISNN